MACYPDCTANVPEWDYFLWQSPHLVGPFFSAWQPLQSLWAASLSMAILAGAPLPWQSLHSSLALWALWLKVTLPFLAGYTTVSAASADTAKASVSAAAAIILFMRNPSIEN